MKKKWISMFMPSLAGGGAEKAMLILAEAFLKKGFAVDLVLTRAEGPYKKNIPSGVRIIDLKSSRIITSLPGLVKYLSSEKVPVLISAMTPANCIALIARSISRAETKVIVCEHSTLSMASINARDYRTKLFPQLIRLLYPRAYGIVAVSKGVADDLSAVTGLQRNGIKVIYNPVITPELLYKAKEPVNHPWFAPGEPPVILGVGRLVPAKDFQNLINAFALVRKKKNARLIILGEGEERPHLEALIKEKGLEKDVAMPGFVDNPYAYMARAKLFVLSSRWEGLPTVLIEAMACGCPVVSTDCHSGPREILENGRWGKLVVIDSPDALANAILKILGKPKAIVSENFKRFSAENVVDQYAKLISEVQSNNIR